MEEHRKHLKKLCRVCGTQPKKYTYSKHNDSCKPLLLSAFGVDVSTEAEEVYPTNVCNNCYRSMQRIVSAKESGVMMKSSLSLFSWLPHSEDACSVCQFVGSSSGRPKKKKLSGIGRPCNDDICHLSREIMRTVNEINPPHLSNFTLEVSLFLPTPNISSLLCKHCQHIPSTPIEVLPCHHLVCVPCIQRITMTQVLTCTCNAASVTVTHPHPIIIELLGNLLLTCPECSEVLKLADLLSHLTSNCTSTTSSPSLLQVSVEQLLNSPMGSSMEQHVMGLLVDKFIPCSGPVTYRLPSGKV